MAVYAIGDIQGCHEELLRLLDRIHFDPTADTLWFVGDIINRGPRSLDALRFVKNLGPSAIMVLGNHDLNLLAVREGIRSTKPSDTLDDILHAPDADELLTWLRQRPLLHYDKTLDTVLVHAGLPPQWRVKQARKRAREVETVLAGNDYPAFLHVMYGDRPRKWKKSLQGMDRLRFITNALTRIRYVDHKGRLDLNQKGAPGTQPKNLTPWFAYPGRKSMDTRIVFGHWSTLGLRLSHNTVALDTGCLWGGEMTALRVDAPEITLFSVDCPGAATP